MAKKKQRLPFGVGCIATFMLLGSLFLIAAGVLYVLHSLGTEVLGLTKHQWADVSDRYSKYVFIVGLVLGLINLPIAIGLFARKFWAYCAYTAINGLDLGLAGFRLIAHHHLASIPNLVINICILTYFFLPGVRKAFS